jgi:hypothetical protein
MNFFIPDIDRDFFCIANRESPELAAVISSYLIKADLYLPMFEFPLIIKEKDHFGSNHIDEFSISRSKGIEFDIKVLNSLKRLGGCKHLLLIGLTQEQKSFLTFLNIYNTIEINSFGEIDFFLEWVNESLTNNLICNTDNYLEALIYASQTKSKLKLVDEICSPPSIKTKKEGIIIIEKKETVSTIIAINYSIAVNAEILLVEPLLKGEEEEIKHLIISWKTNNTIIDYNILLDKITKRISNVIFNEYKYATFFTDGIPYSLYVKNIIPCSYVSLLYNTDFFLFNNIFFEKKLNVNSAVIFSPEFFKYEETDCIIKLLDQKNFYVKELIGKDASVYNIDMYIKEFPYDIFHICSHGGEINGYTIKEEFYDRDGKSHLIEYDEVVSFAPTKGKEMIPVHRKTIWRKFDGYVWKTPEFKKQNYPQYVFSDMLSFMSKSFKGNEIIRVPKEKIYDSCSIKCSDFNYQAMINYVSGQIVSPFIFNNSCYSWSGIADCFLYSGIRGYIGTMWNIDSSIATDAAKLFYDNLFNGSISDALQIAMKTADGTNSENIYIFWGVHFSTIKKGVSKENSVNNIVSLLKSNYKVWSSKAKIESVEILQKNFLELSEWNLNRLFEFFIILKKNKNHF